MKIHSETAVLERGGVEGEKTFRIQANARAFSILSSNLYRFKIRAVIRELCCNALDSHIAAGRGDVPFTVHLPNMMEPYLEISDEGLGLTHEQVMNIYTTYFASTKNETNELIGGLGLGGKSPFAYTNSFTVTAIHNGVSRGYAMVINESGEPSVVPMGETATTDHNGVRVRVPVKGDDFDQFRTEAQTVLCWFDKQPTVVGNSRFSIKKEERLPVFEGARWYFRSQDYYSRTNSLAIMGNVAYPIQSANINDRFRQLVDHNCLVLRFEIGELDIQPSREELSYDPLTVKLLEERLDQVMRELRVKIEQHFVACKTLWEAKCALSDLDRNKDTRNVLGVLSRGGHKIQWQGRDIGACDYIEWTTNGLFNKENPAPNVYNVSSFARAKEKHRLDARSKIKFVIADCADAAVRCRKAYYDGPATTAEVYLIRGADQAVSKLLAYLGDPPTIKASSLPRADRKAMKFKGRVWTGDTYWRSRKGARWSNEAELTAAQGGYYVTVLHEDPVDENDLAIQLKSMINCATTLGILPKDAKIWGLNKTNTKLVKDLPQWTNFYKMFKEEVSKRIALNNTGNLVLIKQELAQMERTFRGSTSRWFDNFGAMNNVVGQMVREWKAAADQAAHVDITELRSAAGLLGLVLEGTGTRPQIYKQWAGVVARYPLMRWATGCTLDTEFAEFVNYVNMVDNT